jgi:hypothetical protein
VHSRLLYYKIRGQTEAEKKRAISNYFEQINDKVWRFMVALLASYANK